MSYEDIEETTFTYFSYEEDVFIQSFLKGKGHTWQTNTVCGSCCGMYCDEYWVNGIGGDFPEDDKKELAALMKEKGYSCSIGRYTIAADPEHEDEYQIKN